MAATRRRPIGSGSGRGRPRPTARGPAAMAAARGRLVAVSASAQVGTCKRPVAVGMLQKGHGLVGDAHAGTGRQVSLLARESIDAFARSDAALRGEALGPGDFAENLTTSGLVLHTLPVGTRLRVGAAAILEITQIGKACHRECEIKRVTGRCVMPTEGVFARVIASGEVRAGDEIGVLPSDRGSGRGRPRPTAGRAGDPQRSPRAARPPEGV